MEGTRSEGGAFYEIKVVKTGARLRYLTKVFEQFAKEEKSMVITVEQLVAELQKHPANANIVLRLNLSQSYELSAESVAYRPGTNQVIIAGGK